MVMPIESGPTKERVVRTLLQFVLIAFFAAWFAYDGWIGYPKRNLRDHLDVTRAEAAEPLTEEDIRPLIYDTVSEDRVAAANEAMKAGSADQIREALTKVFGAPPSFETDQAWFYFGATLRLIIPMADGLPTGKVMQRSTPESAASIATQKGLAVGLAVAAVGLGFFLARVARTRLVLDEAGLAYNQRPVIPWDAMRSLDTSRFNRKGQVDLIYDDGGAERRLRLDEYHLARFEEIVDELCARKGFANPLPEPSVEETGNAEEPSSAPGNEA